MKTRFSMRRPLLQVKRRPLHLLAVAAIVLGAAVSSSDVFAAAKPGFSLIASPSTVTVPQGGSGASTVSMTPLNGFTGQVTLSVSAGMPTGAGASFSRNPVAPNTATCSNCQTSTLSITAAATTPPGTYPLTISGVSGALKSAASVSLVVTSTTSAPSFRLSASPSSASVSPGSTATYSVAVARTSFTANVGLSVTGLPAGAAASLSPNPVVGPSGASSTLTVTTSSTMAASTSTLTVTGTGGSPSQTSSTSVTLAVASSGPGFTIQGNAQGAVYPGTTQPLAITLTNPNSYDLSITDLTVSISGVTTLPGTAGGCTAADFTVGQFSGTYPIRLYSSRTISLSDLGIPQAQWPRVTMINQPVNQDGCKGATVNLAYRGSAGKVTS